MKLLEISSRGSWIDIRHNNPLYSDNCLMKLRYFIHLLAARAYSQLNARQVEADVDLIWKQRAQHNSEIHFVD